MGGTEGRIEKTGAKKSCYGVPSSAIYIVLWYLHGSESYATFLVGKSSKNVTIPIFIEKYKKSRITFPCHYSSSTISNIQNKSISLSAQ